MIVYGPQSSGVLSVRVAGGLQVSGASAGYLRAHQAVRPAQEAVDKDIRLANSGSSRDRESSPRCRRSRCPRLGHGTGPGLHLPRSAPGGSPGNRSCPARREPAAQWAGEWRGRPRRHGCGRSSSGPPPINNRSVSGTASPSLPERFAFPCRSTMPMIFMSHCPRLAPEFRAHALVRKGPAFLHTAGHSPPQKVREPGTWFTVPASGCYRMPAAGGIRPRTHT